MIKYDGTDFSGEWRVVTFEGKTIPAQWKLVKDEDERLVLVFSDEYAMKPLVGFRNYRFAAQAARKVDGVPVRA